MTKRKQLSTTPARKPVTGWPVTILFRTRKEALRYAVAMGCLIAGAEQPKYRMRVSAITGLQLGRKAGR